MTSDEIDVPPSDATGGYKKLKHLPDTPVSDDVLAGKAHARTAKALVDIILDDGPTVRAIGLEGAWGSGKSSVIEIARKTIETLSGERNNYHLFTFDVWAHQGDPLRRSFLDKFIHWLRDKGRIHDDDKEKWLEQIQAKIKRTTTHTTPKLRPIGVIMVLLALLLPLIYVWLSPLAFGEPLKDVAILGVPKSRFQAVFLTLLLLPYIVLLWKRFISNDTWTDLGKEIMLLSRISDVDKSYQVVRDEDPTSVEFGNFINKIIKTAANKNNKLLIVIDNLDRLPQDQISDAWAIMRGLIGRDGEPALVEHLSHVWIIVPYDKAHLGNLFDDLIEGDSTFRTDGFIDKTFDVVLRVSPPLITHWREYFHQQLDEAFSAEIDEEQKHVLLRLLEYEFTDSGRRVTPRAIKAYVNDMVSMAMQWGREVPIECMGLYSLKRHQLDIDDASLKEGTLISNRHRALLADVEWQKHLTSLHYNVPLADAYQVLIETDIDSALSSANSDRLNNLSENPGFDLVLGHLVNERGDEWAGKDASSFAMICKTLSELKTHRPSFNQVWNTLRLSASYLNHFSTITDDVIEGLTALVRFQHNKRKADAANAVAKRLCGGPIVNDDFVDGGIWLRALDSINNALPEDERLGGLEIPGGADFTCGAIAELRNAETLKFAHLRVKVKSDELTTRIIDDISADPVPDSFEFVLESLSSKPNLIAETSIGQAIKNRLSSAAHQIDVEDEEKLLRGLLSVSFNKSGTLVDRAHLEALNNDGTLLYLFKEGREYDDGILSALAAFAIMQISQSGNPPAPGNRPPLGDFAKAHAEYVHFKNDATGMPEVVSSLADIVGKFHVLSELVTAAISHGGKESAFSQVLMSCIEKRNYQRLNINNVIENFGKIQNLVGKEKSAKFLRSLSGWAPRIKPNIVDNIDKHFLETLHSSLPNRLEVIFAHVEKRLKKLNETSWVEALRAQDHSAALLLGMLRTKGIKVPSGNFRNALLEYSKELIRGDVTPTNFLDDLHLLPKALATQSMRAFYQDVVSWLRDNATTAAHARHLFRFLPDFVGSVDAKSYSEVFVNRLLVPLIGEPVSENLKLVSDNLSFFKTSISNAPKNSKALASETMEGAVTSCAISDRKMLQNIADELSIAIDFNDG